MALDFNKFLSGRKASGKKATIDISKLWKDKATWILDPKQWSVTVTDQFWTSPKATWTLSWGEQITVTDPFFTMQKDYESKWLTDPNYTPSEWGWKSWPPPISSISTDKLKEQIWAVGIDKVISTLTNTYGKDATSTRLKWMQQQPQNNVTTTTVTTWDKKMTQAEMLQKWIDKAAEMFWWDQEKAKDYLRTEFSNRGKDFDSFYSAAFWGKETIIDTKVDPIWETDLTTDIDSINSYIEDQERRREEYNSMKDSIIEEQRQLANDFASTIKEAWLVMDNTTEERMSEMDDSYTKIFDTIEELNAQAEQLFDKSVIEATKVRASQLAEQGILTSEQAAASAWFIMRNYTAIAELKRGEMVLENQARMANALKDRQAAQDAILKDKSLNEQTKVALAEKANTMYNNIINNYQKMTMDINNAVDATIDNAYAKQIEVELASYLPMVEQEVNQKLDAEQKKILNSDPQKRVEFIINQISALSPDLLPWTAEILKQMQSDGTLMTTPLEQIIIASMAKWAISAWKALWTSSWLWSTVWGTTNTGTVNQAWTESTDTSVSNMAWDNMWTEMSDQDLIDSILSWYNNTNKNISVEDLWEAQYGAWSALDLSFFSWVANTLNSLQPFTLPRSNISYNTIYEQ